MRKQDAFQRAFVLLTPHMLRQINDAVIAAAVRLRIEDRSELRVDSTVVETAIRDPRDSGLLWDSVRVITRLVEALREPVPDACRGHPTRPAVPGGAFRRLVKCASAPSASASCSASTET